MIRIAVITGSRAEYGIMRKLLNLFAGDQNIELQLIVTGTHLSPEYGMTIKNIKDDGFVPTATVECTVSSNTKLGTAKSISLAILGIAEKLDLLKPHFTIVLGDRFEIFAAGIAAIHSGSILVHIHGGDMSNSVFDDYYRNSLTQMSQIHFTASKKSLETVLMLGSNPHYVFLSGSPTLDEVINTKYYNRNQIAQKLELRLEANWALLIYHPSNDVTKSVEEFNNIITNLQILDAIYNLQIVAIYPNADAGGSKIIQILQSINRNDNLRIVKNLPRELYLSLLKEAIFMIGNSSSGIFEGTLLAKHIVNVGTRQQGREKDPRIINIEGTHEQISTTLSAIMQAEEELPITNSSIYGDGNASLRIYNTLLSLSSSVADYPPILYNNLELITKISKIANIDYSTFPDHCATSQEIIKLFGATPVSD